VFLQEINIYLMIYFFTLGREIVSGLCEMTLGPEESIWIIQVLLLLLQTENFSPLFPSRPRVQDEACL